METNKFTISRKQVGPDVCKLLEANCLSKYPAFAPQQTCSLGVIYFKLVAGLPNDVSSIFFKGVCAG